MRDRRSLNFGPCGKPVRSAGQLNQRQSKHVSAALRALARACGGYGELAKALGVSLVTLKQWRYRAMSVNAAVGAEKLCRKLSVEYGREDYRPDLFKAPPKPTKFGGITGVVDYYD